MRPLLFAAAAGIALTGCQTVAVDTAIQQNLPKICQALETAHTAFAAVSAFGKIRKTTVAEEAAAYAGAHIICVHPDSTTAADAVVLAARAYSVIDTALQQARMAE